MSRDPDDKDESGTLAERFARKLAERRLAERQVADAAKAAAKAAAKGSTPSPSAAPAAPTKTTLIAATPAPTIPPATLSSDAATATDAVEPPATPAPTPEPPDRTVRIDFNRFKARGIITPDNENSAAIEEFRFIKRQVIRMSYSDSNEKIRDNGNVIMVTSAVAGEGKSISALNLAISFSLELDFYVLLVDADNRRHTITDLMGVDPNDAGMVDLLVDPQLQMRDIIRRTSIPNLTFIPAGRPHPRGTEILASKQMATTMNDMTKRYPDRIIIIDTPPLLASTEGVVLSSHVGHAIVVVEKHRTTKRSLHQALARLKGCPEVSCILSVDTEGRLFAQKG